MRPGSFGSTLVCLWMVASVTNAQSGDGTVSETESPASTEEVEPVPDRELAIESAPVEALPLEGPRLEASAPVESAPIAEPEPIAANGDPVVELEWGRGLTVRSEDGAFSLTIRGRVQALAEVSVAPSTTTNPDSEESVEFMVRRGRLLFAGNLISSDLQYYVQLGMAPRDMEPDLLIPLRDAYLTFTGIPNLSIRAGQMKVPFNRERVISSSSLQLVDRSPVNLEFTLDRDIGVQIFGTDLFGLGGILGYQIGVFQGDGRLRVNEGAGLLYVGRLQVQPLGAFEDGYVEADLTREERARLSIGLGGAFNHEARRTRSTTGDFYQLGGFDYAHAELDFMFKYAGFSAMGELVYRQTTGASTRMGTIDGLDITEVASNGLGYFLQAGYLFEPMIEVAARYAEIVPVTSPELPVTSVRGRREITLGLNWYPLEHNLKLQFDWSHISDPAGDFGDGTHRFRLQMQAYF